MNYATINRAVCLISDCCSAPMHIQASILEPFLCCACGKEAAQYNPEIQGFEAVTKTLVLPPDYGTEYIVRSDESYEQAFRIGTPQWKRRGNET
jgi:CO dehydrogenase/acetyl-CoA synthase beta subunit